MKNSSPLLQEASSLTVYRKKQGEGIHGVCRAAFEEHLKDAPLIGATTQSQFSQL
jgi:hypothetical protein